METRFLLMNGERGEPMISICKVLVKGGGWRKGKERVISENQLYSRDDRSA